MIKLELYKKRNKLKNIKKNLKGTIVPVPSFYKDNLNLDYDKLGKFIDFQLRNNINNFYLALSASEFEFMSEKERISIAKFISKIIPKKSILLSQPIGSGSLESQIDEGKRMIDAGADALVIKPQSLKENANFFSSKYLSRSYSPKKHDGFYISFMEKFSISTKCPLVYHDHPFSNGFGLILSRKWIDTFFLCLELLQSFSDPLIDSLQNRTHSHSPSGPLLSWQYNHKTDRYHHSNY